MCGEQVSKETGRCEGCGAVYGEAHRCPHCRSIADVEASEALRFRCSVCGGPRVVADDPALQREHGENPALELARKAHARRTAWQMGSAVVGGFGGIALLVALAALAVVSPGFFLTTLALLMVAAPLLFSVFGFRKAKRAGEERDAAIDRAWTSVARELSEAHDAKLSPRQLAKLMRIDETQAELLLAQVSVDDFVRSRIEEPPERKARVVDDDAIATDTREAAEEAAEAAEADLGRAHAKVTADPKD